MKGKMINAICGTEFYKDETVLDFPLKLFSQLWAFCHAL